MVASDDLEQPPQEVEGVRVYAAERSWGMGLIGPCLFVIWRHQVTETALQHINDQIWDLSQQRPSQCAYINVIEKHSPPPSAPLRKIAMAGVARPGKALTCMAAVMEGNELQNVLVRAVLTSMALLRSQAQPSKIFKDTQAMSTWVKKMLQTAGAETSDDLVRAVEVVRSRMPA